MTFSLEISENVNDEALLIVLISLEQLALSTLLPTSLKNATP
jgi:hypothetical protein